MAKKRKKKNSGATLTYEVYGILILILSVIALAGQGPIAGMGAVGRSLNYICLFIAGELYFVIPLITIYIGLYVMVKRQWPKGWTYRRTGVLLLLLAVLALRHIGMHQELYLTGEFTSGAVFSQPWQNMKEFIDVQKDVEAFYEELGGGMLGALIFGFYYIFFDLTGSKLVVYAMIAIGFLYVTGLSYVELGAKLRAILKVAGRKGRKEWRGASEQFRKKRNQLLAARAVQAEADQEDDREEVVYKLTDEIDEETYRPLPADKPKRSLFMELIKPGKPDKAQRGGQPKQADQPGTEPLPEDDLKLPDDAAALPATEQQEARDLLVRDFQEHAAMQPSIAVQEEHTAADMPDGPVAAEAGPDDGTGAGASAPERAARPPYKLPPFHFLSKPSAGRGALSTDYKANARKLETTLESFGVRAKVLEVVRGPAVTRYEIMPDTGVKVSRIVSLTDDIALALAAKDIRMEAPIPGKSAIGIEVPNTEVSVVTMREVMESASFHESSAKLSVVLGRDISGQPIVGNLAKMPHLLVAGATGSGKSVCINCIITSILYKARPDEVKFLMIDPKMVELNVYNGVPHLLAPVVTDPRRASLALKKVVLEMEKRYDLFSKSMTRNMEGYNALAAERGHEPLPYIVVIVDELADLMMVAAGDVEDAICRLAQMARAAGIHLIIATQRPSVDVITGVIKANIPSRIAFGVSSQVDSRTILDAVGAEKLLGRGDMLYLPVGESKPIRIQGAFLSDREVESVVSFVSSQEKAEYQEELVPEVDDLSDSHDELTDELFDQAAQIVVEAKQASVSLLQRKLRIGYNRAARLIDSLESSGIVGPYEGSKPREVLMSVEQFRAGRASS